MGSNPPDNSRKKLGYDGYLKAKQRLFDEQDGECYYCFRKSYMWWQDAPDKESTINALATIDHVVPTSSGGTWKKYNIVMACRQCNAMKCNMSEEEFHEIIMKKII